MIPLTRSLIASPSALLASSDAKQLADLWKITVGAGAVIGAVAGLQHDGLQAVYSAVKMPGMLLIPPLLVLPALQVVALCHGDRLAGLSGAFTLPCLARNVRQPAKPVQFGSDGRPAVRVSAVVDEAAPALIGVVGAARHTSDHRA